ncbi:MAG: hypothetical protein LBD37_00565 [Treponema sp.]|jgi:hypothetical protein|nr:hypothetical protein [Treponema sp.]
MKRWVSRFVRGIGAVFGALVCSCSSGSAAVEEVWGGRAQAPVFLACRAVSAAEITFQFSVPVRVLSMRLDPAGDVQEIQEGELVAARLHTPYPGGARVLADLVVEDAQGNTLNVLVPFRARNDALPSLLITEIRTEYAKPKVEFVEFKTLGAGNLGALRLFIAGAGMDAPFFEFPPAPVKAGEYVVVHLRSLDGLWADETGDDLGAVPYTKDNEAQPEARDFWIPGSKKHIAKKADAVYLLDQDDRVLDALLINEGPGAWGKDAAAQAAEFLGSRGAWLGAAGGLPGPDDAVISRDATATRSICRDENAGDSNRAADWYITATSGASPGRRNSDKRYDPKAAKRRAGGGRELY